jgi:hypothetical protein
MPKIMARSQNNQALFRSVNIGIFRATKNPKHPMLVNASADSQHKTTNNKKKMPSVASRQKKTEEKDNTSNPIKTSSHSST